jgi:polyhydroxyalkanoate synthesis repressor PhaR
MQTIKKYANRKLYHTNRKRYITLDGIGRLVQAGEHVQVIDNETGEDITGSILAQVVLQTRGRNGGGGPLPATVLTGLIQFSGDTLTSLRRVLLNSLGGQEIIEAEIKRRLDKLVAEDTLSSEEDTRLRHLLLREDLAQEEDQTLEVHEEDVPSRQDVVRLHAQVDALTAVVEQLMRQHGGAVRDDDH